MTAPVVSVLIPAFNGARWLSATLDSLGRQTLPEWEAIVVDDCSTDDTRAIVAAWPDPRVRLIALPANGGPVRARNHAAGEARGRYLAGLDQDDLCRPQRLARQVAYLEAHPGCALVGCGVEVLAGDIVRASAYPPVTTPGLLSWLLRIENPLAWSGVMLRTSTARALAPFTRPELLYAEDFDLYHRVLAHGHLARLDEPLLLYRQHAGGASQRFTATMRDSAAQVLAACHADLPDPQRAAALLVRYNMGGLPVPDRATFAELGALLGRLQAEYFDSARPDAEMRRLVRWETARRWARIGRAGLRAGTLGMRDVLTVRPAHLGLGYAGPEALAMAGLIGGGRRLTRSARQTLAAKIMRPSPSRANT